MRPPITITDGSLNLPSLVQGFLHDALGKTFSTSIISSLATGLSGGPATCLDLIAAHQTIPAAIRWRFHMARAHV